MAPEFPAMGARELAAAVIAALDGVRGTWGGTVVHASLIEAEYDLGYNEETGHYQVAVDVAWVVAG